MGLGHHYKETFQAVELGGSERALTQSKKSRDSTKLEEKQNTEQDSEVKKDSLQTDTAYKMPTQSSKQQQSPKLKTPIQHSTPVAKDVDNGAPKHRKRLHSQDSIRSVWTRMKTCQTKPGNKIWRGIL